jgi:hypothetical protein
MNAGLAFLLADEALTASGASPPGPPRRRSRRSPRRSRVFILAAALVVIVLGTLDRDAVADPARSGETAQSGGDASAGAASAKKKRSANKPRAKKRSADKPGAKKGGDNKRKRRVRRVDLFYTAKITGTGKYEYTNDGPSGSPDSEYTSPGSGYGGAWLRAARASAQLHRELFTHPTTKRTTRYYGFELSASGELSNGTSTDSSRGWRHKYNASGCPPTTALGTEFGPSPIDLQVSGTLGLRGQGPRITASRSGPASGTTTTYGSAACTQPDGTTIQVRSETLTGVGAVPMIPASCNNYNGLGGPEITSVASGKVVWGRAFTISVTCAEKQTTSVSSARTETSLKIAMAPCPGRATKPCQ